MTMINKLFLNFFMKRIISLKDCNKECISVVGGKNSNLGEMIKGLADSGINLPCGFATTSYAFREYMTENALYSQISEIIHGTNVEIWCELEKCGLKCRELILKHPLSKAFTDEITQAYLNLCQSTLKNEVAVRSSGTAEDLPGISFAGQHDSFLNITGIDNVVNAVLAW